MRAGGDSLDLGRRQIGFPTIPHLSPAPLQLLLHFRKRSMLCKHIPVPGTFLLPVFVSQQTHCTRLPLSQ